MPDYKTLYQILLNVHGRAIDILTQAGLEAEEVLLDSMDPFELFSSHPESEEDSEE